MDLEKRVNESFFGKARKRFNKIKEGLSNFYIGARVSTALLAAVISAGTLATKAEAVTPDWDIETTVTTNSDAGGPYLQFVYTVINKGGGDPANKLEDFTLGSGTDSNGQIYLSAGGYRYDLNWTSNENTNNVHFNVAGGEPITPGGNPNGDYGTFIVLSRQMQVAQRAANAESNGNGPFPIKYIPGPARVHDIASSATTNGNISPLGVTQVSENLNQVYIIAPDEHYHTLDVLVDGFSIGPTNSYTFSNVATGHTINASFDIDQHNLVVSSTKATPSPDVGTNTFDYGTVVTNTIDDIVEEGNTRHINTGFTGTGSIPSQGDTNYFTGPITNDSSITWTWQTQHNLDTDTDGNGNVDTPDAWYDEGTNKTIVASPNQFYHFDYWGGDTNGAAISNNQITVTFNEPKYVKANFAVDQTSNGIDHTWLDSYGLATNDVVETQDNDHDQYTTLDEWIALTNPTNSHSYLRLINFGESNSYHNLTIPESSTERVYTVYGMPEVNKSLATPITSSYGNGGDLTLTFSDTNATKHFYYVGVDLPE